MKRWAYRLGQMLGSGMAGQRLQLDDWQRTAWDRRNGIGSPDDLRAMADQRQAEQERIAEYNRARTTPLWAQRCNDPYCQRCQR